MSAEAGIRRDYEIYMESGLDDFEDPYEIWVRLHPEYLRPHPPPPPSQRVHAWPVRLSPETRALVRERLFNPPPKPAPPIEEIKTCNEFTQIYCVVCMESHNKCDSVLTPCEHSFGKECFDEWVEKTLEKRAHVTCPICREAVTKITNFNAPHQIAIAKIMILLEKVILVMILCITIVNFWLVLRLATERGI